MQQPQVGKTISRTRKALGLTQEQLGRRLGVSAGAVSKWETGSALPDISLLAPLARALNISLDTLLRYEAELSGEEYAALCKQIDDAFILEGAEAGREKLYKALHAYPNNGGLKILGAKNLHMFAKPKKGDSPMLEEALALYKDAQEVDGGRYKSAALFGMADIYMLQGRYEQSQACLSTLAEDSGFDPMLLYPRLLIEQEKWPQAAKACKGQLLQYLNSAIAMVGQLAHIANRQGDVKGELFFLQKQTMLEETFDVGLHMGSLMLARYYLRQHQPQKAATWYLAYVKGIIAAPLSYAAHPIYGGLALQADEAAQLALRQTMLRELAQDSTYAPIHQEPAYQKAQGLIDTYTAHAPTT